MVDYDDESELGTYWRLRHQHPVCHFEDETGDFRARKVSDFVSKGGAPAA